MKRIGNLFETIVSYENLYQAYLNAKKGKRFRSEVLQFSHNLESNLIELQNELITKTYRVGKYREFYVYEPKKRLIMALPFRDRVVQWAVYQVVEPLISKRFFKQSYACQTGKGSHLAAKELQNAIRKMERTCENPYYLQGDISKYFYRVSHDVLISILDKIFKDRDLMWLFVLIIKSEDMNFGVPLGDHDFDEERLEEIGMPIGNLLSQTFANLYLHELDKFVKYELRMHYYFRYMDDFVILYHDKRELREILEEIDLFLRFELKLQLNNKTAIRPTKSGIEFVGKRIWSTHVKIRKSTIKKMKSRLKYVQGAYARNDMTLDEVKSVLASYNGLLKHAQTHHLRKSIYKNFKLKRA